MPRTRRNPIVFGGSIEDLEGMFEQMDIKRKRKAAPRKRYTYHPASTNLVIVESETIEHTGAAYPIGPEVMEIIRKYPSDTYKRSANLFTKLRPYESYATPIPLVEGAGRKPEAEPYDEEIVRALFWLPNRNRYSYLRLRIAKSTIKKAGKGVYAIDPIPKGAEGIYAGVARIEKDANMYYSWSIRPWDPLTGEPSDADPIYYIDAVDPSVSNWTRYVNCGPTSASNNIDSAQRFGTMFYIAIRDIDPDEELFVDYGAEYRTTNLKMKGRY